jgi:hypothetical protein
MNQKTTIVTVTIEKQQFSELLVSQQGRFKKSKNNNYLIKIKNTKVSSVFILHVIAHLSFQTFNISGLAPNLAYLLMFH